jgi:hypothetical protein
MEEAVKALAPWPVLQGVVIGLIVAAVGFWAMRRGLQENKRRETATGEALAVRLELADDERKAQWKAHEQLDHLHENSFKIVRLLEQLVEATQASKATLEMIRNESRLR